MVYSFQSTKSLFTAIKNAFSLEGISSDRTAESSSSSSSSKHSISSSTVVVVHYYTIYWSQMALINEVVLHSFVPSSLRSLLL